jgi:hypothetical protein
MLPNTTTPPLMDRPMRTPGSSPLASNARHYWPRSLPAVIVLLTLPVLPMLLGCERPAAKPSASVDMDKRKQSLVESMDKYAEPDPEPAPASPTNPAAPVPPAPPEPPVQPPASEPAPPASPATP